MRILHFSDPHIPTPLRHVPLRKWLSKRAIGGAHLLLRRSRLFADASKKLTALSHFKTRQNVDLVICTGDYTALGLPHEYQEAVRTARPLMDAPHGYINVPGNHDYYLDDALQEKRFHSYFRSTLISDLPEHQVDGPWPLVRLIGEDLAFIAVNSSRPNPLPWQSSGKIPERQLVELKKLSEDSRLTDRRVFIMTHYAPLLADGNPDTRRHGLTNAHEFLQSCACFQQALILCGHIHRCYHVTDKTTGHPIFCAGSATLAKKESFWLFDIRGDEIRATKGRLCGHVFELQKESAILL